MSFEDAHSEVKELVDQFKANEKYFLSNKYQEAEVRKDFIDRFFMALGWDVLHQSQKNPYEQEVKVERGVDVSGAQKRADYSFALPPNYRDPKFFVEAKKPARDLTNKDYYFQTVRYGWHKTTPLVVLTDFEEFHILDCRFSPDINTILSRQVKKYHYSDYVDNEKFAEIYWLFSREAVVDNSLEKYADTLPKPKGKAYQKALFAYEKHLSIDDAFLEEIDGIRVTLAKAFKKNDDTLNSEELTEATQRTIDRLVFIRFLEDKLIEPEHYVNTFGEGKSAWGDFISLSTRLDAKYNGIVFKKSFIDKSSFKGPVDTEFHEICQNICHLNSRFLFNEIPIHILGSIYERFLGKVVHATAKRVTVEEKPEVRKAGGVYYTPKYIVDYIVQNTVGKLIENKTPEQIANLHFADIACGSGSFLIGVLECLLDYHNKYYQEHPSKAKKSGCLYKDGLWILSIKQKQNILRNNIYGVDIDSQAVEVTQLSLSLKMLEDETTATANEMQVLFHEKILPDMSKNIKCGNSLIGSDILSQSLFVLEEERKINPMDYASAFPDIMSTGGFDGIIGNPPYVFTRDVEFGKVVKDYYRSHFLSKLEKIGKTRANQTGKVNLFGLFLLRAFTLINDKGQISYIVPNTILRTTVYEGLRKYFLDNASIERIVDLKEGVFEKVTASTVILVLGKNKIKKDVEIVDNPEGIKSVSDVRTILSKDSFYPNPSYAFNIFINYREDLLFKKMNAGSEKLGALVDIFNGIATFKNKQGLHKTKVNDSCKKILMGKDIARYTHKWKNLYIEYIPDKLQRARNESIFLVSEKLIMQRIAGILVTSYDDESYYTFNSVNNLILKSGTLSLKYILGIVNSKQLKFYYIKNFTNKSNLTVNISKTYLDQLPIPKINFDKDAEKTAYYDLIRLVNNMLRVKKQLHVVRTDKDKAYYERRCIEIDSQIDTLVYKLYGLTDEEIEIVEKSVQ